MSEEMTRPVDGAKLRDGKFIYDKMTRLPGYPAFTTKASLPLLDRLLMLIRPGLEERIGIAWLREEGERRRAVELIHDRRELDYPAYQAWLALGGPDGKIADKPSGRRAIYLAQDMIDARARALSPQPGDDHDR